MEEDEDYIRYHVSSRHLALASGFFKSSLARNGWLESQPNPVDGKYHISASDWDPETFLILLDIFHLRNRAVPRKLSLEMLAKMPVLVDYYRCSEAVEIFSDMWINTVRESAPVPSEYSRDLMLWMCIAWVFKLPTEFEKTTKTAFMTCRSQAIENMSLPIPKPIFGSSPTYIR